ncbi:MAG TPA: carboxypeptidase regulatory-like domain-containing protein [Micromonospora sp.]|nr:carboxypeptidase regulatory-like domain-containing protein [Micromonospora sp.]
MSVVNGQATTVNEQFLPTGTITGQLRDRGGDPLAYTFVRAYDPQDFAWFYASTDDEGRYRMTVLPGRYVVSFEPIEGIWQSQYIPQQVSEGAATRFEVRADEEVVADDTVLPTGSLSGRFTTEAGQPLSRAEVDISTPDWGSVAYLTTNSNGEFTVPTLLVGSYKVSFWHRERQQYYAGKTTFEEADLVTVRADDETRITDSLLPTGSVRVFAVDADTGAAVPDFCVLEGECSNGTGSVLVPDLTRGPQTLSLYTDTGTHFSTETEVDVQPETTIDITVELRPAARIAVTVVDRQTGAPVSRVCVEALEPTAAQLPDGYGYCTDKAGRMIIGPLEAGTYHLFADTRQTSYGMQWVGPDGGAGDQRSAAAVVATVGTTVEGPQVKLDPAGTIAGRVTDAANGAALPDVHVELLSFHPGSGPKSDAVTDGQGRYEFTGLGPYQWPLLFSKGGFAPQWSGNVGDRYKATTIPVTAGDTATYDIALVAGTEVRGSVTTQDGSSAGQGYLLAHNATNGDIVGLTWMPDGQYRMQVLGVQKIYFTYHLHDGDDRSYQGRYLPKRGPHRGIYTIPAAGRTINMVIQTG